MELQIEKWVNKTKAFSKESKDLFDEAVKCYKVGANRAAFIMSYLAFEKEIQLRILNFTTVPNDVGEEEWNSICKNLQNESEWEKTIFKEVIQKNKIMKLPNKNTIEKKLQVYKVTRNACTHANGHTVNAATVEEFWNFLKDNMQNFNVNGGKEYFKEALYISFRDRNEEINIDYKEILESMKYASLNDSELLEIWSYIYKKMHNIDRKYSKEFWDDIIYDTNDNIRKNILDFIKSSCEIFSYFYKMNKDILDLIFQHEGGINFRKEILWQWIVNGDIYNIMEEEYWNLVIKIIKYCNHESDVDYFVKSLKLDYICIVPTEEQDKILTEVDFFKKHVEFINENLKYNYNNVYDQLQRIEFIAYMIMNGIDYLCMDKLNWYIYHIYTKSKKYDGTRRLYEKFKLLLLNNSEFTLRILSDEQFNSFCEESRNIISKKFMEEANKAFLESEIPFC